MLLGDYKNTESGGVMFTSLVWVALVLMSLMWVMSLLLGVVLISATRLAMFKTLCASIRASDTKISAGKTMNTN